MSKKAILIILIVILLLAGGGAGGWYFNHFSVKLSIPETGEQNIEYAGDYTPPTVTAVFSGDYLLKNGITLKVEKEGSVDPEKLGTYTETYTAKYLWMTSTATRTIHVVDSTPPVLTLTGDAELSIDQDSVWSDPGCTASDNVDGDLTGSVTVDNTVDTAVCGTTILTYSVSDKTGNKATAQRIVRVVDVTPPVISLSGDAKMSVAVGGTFTDPGASATDNVDSDVAVTVDGSVNTAKAGTYTLTYTAMDAAGNTASATRTVTVYRKQQQNVVNPGSKVVYLTFDDGPGKYTQQLLDVLDKYNVKATFFVTNAFPSYNYMIAKEAAAGHTVAIHSATHDYSQIYASESAYYADLNKMSDIIKTQTGITPTIIRFPGGSSNTVSKRYCAGIMTELTQSVTDAGYLYCDWNVTSGDAGDVDTTDEVVENVISGIQKHNISYVLQHDVKSFSVDAVEEIIQWGLENGYTFLPLTESSPMYHHNVSN